MLKRTARDKHSSLLRKFVKSFITLGPGRPKGAARVSFLKMVVPEPSHTMHYTYPCTPLHSFLIHWPSWETVWNSLEVSKMIWRKKMWLDCIFHFEICWKDAEKAPQSHQIWEKEETSVWSWCVELPVYWRMCNSQQQSQGVQLVLTT